jgi:hypothetical protein
MLYIGVIHKPFLYLSEALKQASRVIPPLRYVADSVFCTATKPPATTPG